LAHIGWEELELREDLAAPSQRPRQQRASYSLQLIVADPGN